MPEEQQQQGRPNRRRRGRRGRGPKPQDQTNIPEAGTASGPPPGPPGPTPMSANPSASSQPSGEATARPQRRDTRGQPRPERGGSADRGGRTHRPPSSDRDRQPARNDRPPRRDGGSDRSRSGGGGSRDGNRDRGPRVFEEIVPQDPISIELGAAFKAAQVAVRDARKALAKRKDEFDDEPEWMTQQLADAERAFEEAATAWTEHLETTGRKVVRR